jgi:hypothetical protein
MIHRTGPGESNEWNEVRFEISGSYIGGCDEAVCWDIAPCSPVEVYGNFRGSVTYIIRALLMEARNNSETSINVTRLQGPTSQNTGMFEIMVYELELHQE